MNISTSPLLPHHVLDFEQPLLDIANRIEELKNAKAQGTETPEKYLADELARLHEELAETTKNLYRQLSPWQKVQVARHPDRPHTQDFIGQVFTGFEPIHGDRRYADDPAMQAGVGYLGEQPVAILGIEKGRSTADRMKYSFGMVKPEGYRKALRVMDMAERFKLPLITLIDTPGAYPGVEAEARGQAEAIASCIERLSCLSTPVIATVIGEGGSGGALALAVADTVLMLEHAVYSVISPEGAAAILWGESTKTTVPQAAANAKLTAQDLMKNKIIDTIIQEPTGGAHRNPQDVATNLHNALVTALKPLLKKEDLHLSRRQRFLDLAA